MTNIQWIDAHCHLADPRLQTRVGAILADAERMNIGFFMQGGVGPEDWTRQIELAALYPGRIGLCFGVHPYWVVDHDQQACEGALDILARLLPQAMGLGETGLDFRPSIVKDSRERQIGLFEAQLELAEVSQKPLVLHLVHAHEEALRILDIWGVPAAKGFVHSFNGSWGKAQDFLQRGLSLSIGGPVVWPLNEKLHQVVAEMPLEYLLLETDSPDQPPPRFKQSLNEPSSLWDVAGKVASIRGMAVNQVLQQTSENFKRLFRYDGK